MSKYKAWKSFEQELSRRLREAGLPAKRNWSSQFETKDGIDIDAGEYVFQLKYGKKPNLVGAWKEANNSKGKDQIPVVVARWKDERNTLAVVSWKVFEDLLKLWVAVGAESE